jgi:hypothetical protein
MGAIAAMGRSYDDEKTPPRAGFFASTIRIPQ